MITNEEMEELDEHSSTPLYRQLADQILLDIKNGVYKKGAQIPTEMELSATFHVSRVTVRKAIAVLTQMGYLERKSGKGTFVAEPKLQRGFDSSVLGFSDMCRQMGVKPGAKTIKIALEEPSSFDKEQMGLSDDDSVICLERLRYADDIPVVLEINRYPATFSFLFGEDLNDSSLYAILKNKHDIVFDHSSKTIDLVFADSRVSRLLGLVKGYPLLRMVSVSHDPEEKYSVISTQLCIGDKFKLTI